MEDISHKYLTEIIKDFELEKPPSDFTDHVMAKITREKKPVELVKLTFFNKNKFLIIFSFTFLSIFLVVFFMSNSQNPSASDTNIFYDVMKLISEKINIFFTVNAKLSSVMLIIIVSIFMLFSLDFVISKKASNYAR